MKKLCWVILVRTNIPECRLQGEINYKQYKESNGNGMEMEMKMDMELRTDKVHREDCL